MWDGRVEVGQKGKSGARKSSERVGREGDNGVTEWGESWRVGREG